MNPTLINANLLKIPLQLAQKPPTSRHAVDNLIALPKNANKLRIHIVHSFAEDKTLKCFSPYCEKYLNPYITSYSFLDISRIKKIPFAITNAQINVCRNYCQHSPDKSKRSGRRDHKKRDEICGEDCISMKKDKIKKKRHDTTKRDGISFNVSLNNIVHEMMRKKNSQKLHEVNKISNFIFKPPDCKACTAKRKKSSKGKLTRNGHQKRSNSSFSVPQKMYRKYERKKKEFKRENYDEIATYNPRTELASICLNNKYGKKTIKLAKNKSCPIRINQQSKGPVPLFMLIKCNSGKSRALIDNYSNNIKYKVGTNEAFIRRSETFLVNSKKKRLSILDSKRSRSEGDFRQSSKLEQFFARAKADKRTQLLQTKTKEKLSDLPKAVLAKAVYEMLKPVIEQEFLQYKEVQSAIQRLEKNLGTYFDRSIPDKNIKWKIKQNPTQDRNKIIREPVTYLDISDPTDTSYCKKDPLTHKIISAPSLNKPDILDPTDYEIVIIAEKSCKADNKSGSAKPCADNSKADDKKKLKAQLCEENKKKDSCGKEKKDSRDRDNKGNKTANPCVNPSNQKLKNILCDDTKKKEKQDPCKSKQENKCGSQKKKDPCKKSSEGCEDDCFKTKKKVDDPCTAREGQDSCRDKKAQEKKDPCPARGGQDHCRDKKAQEKKDPCKQMACCERANISQEPRLPFIKNQGYKQASCEKKTKEKQKALETVKQCVPPSKSETRYCTKPVAKKTEVPEPKNVKCTKVPLPPVPREIKPKPTRAPRQAVKDTWFPVKIKTEKKVPKSCECKPTINKDLNKPSRSPKLSAQLPKPEPAKKTLVDNCKGLFSSICKVFCPGKNKSGKKGASSCTNCENTPDLKGTFGGFPGSASSGSSGKKPRKKPGTMTYAIYRRRNKKYPWTAPPRWSVYQERFFWKRSKNKADPCKTEREEAASNKLQCVCYEEVKKKQANKASSGPCKKKTGEQLNFKPTSHTKICQMEGKTSGSSKCEAQKSGQSLYQQCGELCDQNKNGNENTSDKAEKTSTICSDRLKASDAKKKDQPQKCSAKTKSDTKVCVKRKTYKERCAPKAKSKQELCTKDREETKENCKPKANLEQKDCLTNRPSKTSATPKDGIRSKYPWNKSVKKIDEKQICANESNITKKSMEDEKAKTKDVKDCAKSRIQESKKEHTEKNHEKKVDPCFRDKQKSQTMKQSTTPKCKESKDIKPAGLKPIPCDNKDKQDPCQKKVVQKVSCQDKMQKSDEKKSDKNKKSADKKDSICERIKSSKKSTSGKECFMPKTSERDKPKGGCDKPIKAQEDKVQSIASKKCADSSTRDDSALDQDSGDMFICKVKSLGKSEQLICSTGSDTSTQMKLNDKGVLRILKCKLTKDESGRDVFVCKEIKPDKNKDEMLQEELQQMKDLLKGRSAPKTGKSVSKKLVCHEKAGGGKICDVCEVQEIIEGGKIKKPAEPKKCPFTYQELLKKSEEVRKAASEHTVEESKSKDARKAASVPKLKAKKKFKDC